VRAAPPPRPPDVRRALPWREFEVGLDEAALHGRPILCLAEPHWSSAAQRLALVLGREDDTRALAERAFVPVRLEPFERPDVVARLRWAATALTGGAGPPLLALLTHRGAPFLTYGSLWPEGRPPYPSLRALLTSVAALYRERPDAVAAEARALEARSRRGRGGRPRGEARGPAPLWPSIAPAIDPHFGGLLGLPKLPRAPLLWRLLDEAAAPPVREHVVRTLDALQRGGTLDQLGGGFHHGARDERWVVPHFEKLVPANAALAAVYARAGAAFDRPDFLDSAAAAAAFASEALDEGTMAVAADPAYTTWTAGQVHETLDALQLQAAGLHFGIARDDAPQVLHRVRDLAEMADAAGAPADELQARLDAAKGALARARARRPAPERLRIDAPSWPATTLRWLFEAERHGVAVERRRLEAHLAALLDRPFDPERGYARRDRHWLEDQVAIAAACASAAHARPDLRDTAAQLVGVVLARYRTADGGALTDAPGATAASLDVVDHALEAAVPALTRLLRTLAEPRPGGGGRGSDRGSGDFAAAAARLEAGHAAALRATAPAAP
jgi:uncharacterized protein YyaL (SSP411 family)